MSHPKPGKVRSRSLGNYEVHIAHEGFASIRQSTSGEIMHMRTPPMEEARSLYVEQAQLAARLAEANPEALVIWDVGLGAAANAMAAIECYEAQASLGAVRSLRIISFENDLDSLRLALRHGDKFPYLRHGGPAGILARGEGQAVGTGGPGAVSCGRVPVMGTAWPNPARRKPRSPSGGIGSGRRRRRDCRRVAVVVVVAIG